MDKRTEKLFEEYVLAEEPYYLPIGDEVQIFSSAYKAKLPVLLKGPTGCGKTRFIEYMTYRLGREMGISLPLITVACHEDLTGSDLVGRYLLKGEETLWVDGPLSRAVKAGAICY
ncbi:MAG TPA: AAA family ATPase, partial [Thermodesulfobacteriota bacterium]|nr:AAA family ATPase [Thermodesulfobacteriota bacterium]